MILKKTGKEVLVFTISALLICGTGFPTSTALAQEEASNSQDASLLSNTDDTTSNILEKDSDTANHNLSDSNKSDAINNDSSTENDPVHSKAEKNALNAQTAKEGDLVEESVAAAPAAATWGTVTFDKSAGNQSSEVVAYTSADETLGTRGLYATGSYFSKRYFIGWCENKNYDPATSTLWFSTSTIGEVYPEGFVGNKTLYAIYVGAIELGLVSQAGTVNIIEDETADGVVPDSTLKESSGFGTTDEKSATFYYDPTQDENKLILDSSLNFNEYYGILTYLNPGNILVNSGTWSDGPKQGASYSHVDIHFTIDERVTLANELALSFTSYAFKPSYVLDSNYQIIKSGLSDSVVTNDPTSTFTFNPGDNHSFILRTTIRHDGNKKNALVGTPEQVLSPYILSSASDANFSISKDVARDIALGNTQPLEFSGYIDGVSKASFLKRDVPKVEASPLYIGFAGNKVTFMDDESTLATVAVVHGAAIDTDDFTSETMPQDPTKENYTFKGWNTAADGSGTMFTGSTQVTGDTTVYAQWAPVVLSTLVTFINDGVVHATTDVEKGKTIATSASTGASMPTNPTKDGFTFVGWNTSEDGSGDVFTDQSIVNVNMTVYAIWKKNEVTPIDPSVPESEVITVNSVTKEKQPTQQIAATGDSAAMIAAVSLSAVAALAFAAFSLRRRNTKK